MLHSMELLDVADSEFLGSEEEIDDDESDFSELSEIDQKYLVIPAAKNRLFGRKKPVHLVLGAGPETRTSQQTFSQAYQSCGFSEGLDYNLLAFFCHWVILLLATLFLGTSFGPVANLPSLEFTDVVLPETLLANAAFAWRFDIIQGFKALGYIALGQDLKQFLSVTFTLFGLSAVGARFTFLTFFYIVSVILLIVPMVYEKYEDIIDIVAEKVLIELNNQCGSEENGFEGIACSYYCKRPI